MANTKRASESDILRYAHTQRDRQLGIDTIPEVYCIPGMETGVGKKKQKRRLKLSKVPLVRRGGEKVIEEGVICSVSK